MTIKEDDIRRGIENDRKTIRTTLAGVITKIKEIGNEQYNGQVFDNVYGIFTQLDVTERRILLKGLINICFIVETEILSSTNTSLREIKTAVLETGATIQEELTDMEKFNAQEMVKMKSSVTRIVIIIFSVFLGLAFIFATVFSQNPLESLTKYSEGVKVIAEIFGF